MMRDLVLPRWTIFWHAAAGEGAKTVPVSGEVTNGRAAGAGSNRPERCSSRSDARSDAGGCDGDRANGHSD